MMKNVYALGAYQVSGENFLLDILYRKDETGVPVNYISEPLADTAFNRKILLRVMRLDNLDSRNEPNPDGRYDFIDGVTVQSSSGRIIFPSVEPFGSFLADSITLNCAYGEVEGIGSPCSFINISISLNKVPAHGCVKCILLNNGLYSSINSDSSPFFPLP